MIGEGYKDRVQFIEPEICFTIKILPSVRLNFRYDMILFDEIHYYLIIRLLISPLVA